jgi:hypothetical protein
LGCNISTVQTRCTGSQKTGCSQHCTTLLYNTGVQHGLHNPPWTRLLPESQATRASLPEVSHLAFEPENSAPAECLVPRQLTSSAGA